MAKRIRVQNGTASLVETAFKCPTCECLHTEEHYYKRLERAAKCFVYIRCKGCRQVIGVTSDIRGDVQVWMKKDE